MDQPDSTTDTRRMKAILTLTATVAFASAPLWTSGFGGFDPNRYPNPQVDPPVQPAGYAFSIWGPIYLWLIVSAGFGLVRRADAADWDRVRLPLMVSLVVGTPWISVAQQSPVWATVMIWIMLAAALLAFFRSPVRDASLLAAPLGLYAGWLTAASFVSLGLLGAGYGIGFGETGWAWAAILGALAVGLTALRIYRSPAYGAALAWALVAVAVQNWGADWSLVALALAGAGVAAGAGFVAAR